MNRPKTIDLNKERATLREVVTVYRKALILSTDGEVRNVKDAVRFIARCEVEQTGSSEYVDYFGPGDPDGE